jgi:uncharacterized protein with von Willebrand factor type A (vWA) domain
VSRALRRRYGHAAAFNVGDSVRMVAPWLQNESVMGVVRKRTPKRIYVWTGQTGFGQKVWAFDDKGNPVGFNKVAHPTLRLDLDYKDPFR